MSLGKYTIRLIVHHVLILRKKITQTYINFRPKKNSAIKKSQRFDIITPFL